MLPKRRRSNSRWVEYEVEPDLWLTVAELAELADRRVPENVIGNRLAQGWDAIEAAVTPTADSVRMEGDAELQAAVSGLVAAFRGSPGYRAVETYEEPRYERTRNVRKVWRPPGSDPKRLKISPDAVQSTDRYTRRRTNRGLKMSWEYLQPDGTWVTVNEVWESIGRAVSIQAVHCALAEGKVHRLLAKHGRK